MHESPGRCRNTLQIGRSYLTGIRVNEAHAWLNLSSQWEVLQGYGDSLSLCQCHQCCLRSFDWPTAAATCKTCPTFWTSIGIRDSCLTWDNSVLLKGTQCTYAHILESALCPSKCNFEQSCKCLMVIHIPVLSWPGQWNGLAIKTSSGAFGLQTSWQFWLHPCLDLSDYVIEFLYRHALAWSCIALCIIL